MPSPQDVRDVSLTGYFDTLSDTQIQRFISCVTPWFSAPHILDYSQRDDVITYMVAHVIFLQKQAELQASGAPVPGGIFGARNKVKIEGVGDFGFAVTALSPGDYDDLMKQPSPYVAKLGWLISTLPAGMTVTSPPCSTTLSLPLLALYQG